MTVRPPYPYRGAKTRLAARIADLLPPHSHYVEACGGSLAVLLAKPRSDMETVNDLDGDLVHFWRVLREHPDELARVCMLTPHARAEYYAAQDGRQADDVERARRTFVRLTQGTTQTMQHAGMWARYVTPSGQPLAAQARRYVERFAAVAARLADVSLDEKPALRMVERYGRSPQVCLYVDPPYPGTAAPYRHDIDHEALLSALTGCRAAVVVSGYPGTVYDDALAGWERHEWPARAGGRSGHSVPRTEVVWVRPPC